MDNNTQQDNSPQTVGGQTLQDILNVVGTMQQPLVQGLNTTGQAVGTGTQAIGNQVSNTTQTANPMQLLQMLFSNTQANPNGPMVANMNAAQANNTVAASNPNQSLDPFTAYQQSASDSELKSRFSKDAENMSNDMLLHYANKTDTHKTDTHGTDTNTNTATQANTTPQDLLSKLINISPTDENGKPQQLGIIPNILQFLASGRFANASEQMGAAKVFQAIAGREPMQTGEKQRLATEALYNTPSIIRENQKAAAENLPAQKALLNRGEQFNWALTGNLPQSLQATRQILSGTNPKTGNSIMQEALTTRLQKIKENFNESYQHSDAQIATYNRLRSKGMTQQDAYKKAGL